MYDASVPDGKPHGKTLRAHRDDLKPDDLKPDGLKPDDLKPGAPRGAISLSDYPLTLEFDGVVATFRPMTPADRAAILSFARSLPENDLHFLRTDITQGEVVDAWLREIESGQTTTLLAEVEGQIVGYCSLHRSESLWTRHLGEILLLVSTDVRRSGLGGHLARQILELAKSSKLQKLVAQMMSTQRDAQNLFHHLGFIPESMLHDWVIDRSGRTHNLIMMSREVDPDEEFFPISSLVRSEVDSNSADSA